MRAAFSLKKKSAYIFMLYFFTYLLCKHVSFEFFSNQHICFRKQLLVCSNIIIVIDSLIIRSARKHNSKLFFQPSYLLLYLIHQQIIQKFFGNIHIIYNSRDEKIRTQFFPARIKQINLQLCTNTSIFNIQVNSVHLVLISHFDN